MLQTKDLHRGKNTVHLGPGAVGEHISVTEYSHSSAVSLASVEFGVVAICRDSSCKELATAERTSLRSE